MQQIFLSSTASRPMLVPTQSPVEWVPGFIDPGVNRLGLEADLFLPFSAEFKRVWSYTSFLPYVFMAWINVIFTFVV